MDPMYIEADGDNLYGFQTWEFFSESWEGNKSERHYVCSVVVELMGTPIDEPDCQGCEQAYDVVPALLETDCSETHATNDAWTSLTRIGLGTVDADLAIDDPHPGSSEGTWVDYGTGAWEAHGWAYAASLDQDGSDAAWGDAGYNLWPAFSWDLDAL